MKKSVLFGSFQKKLILGFIASSLIPLLLAVFIFYRISIDIAEDKILTTVDNSGHQLYEAVNERVKQLERLSDSMQYYVYVLSNTSQEPITEYMIQYSNIRSLISSMKDSFQLLEIVVYLDSKYYISNEGIMFRKLDALDFLLTEAEQQRTGVTSDWKLFLDQPVLNIHSGTYDLSDYLSYYCTKASLRRQQLEYAYFININCKELEDMLLNSYPESEISAYIVDQSGMILAHRDRGMAGTFMDHGLMERTFRQDGEWLDDSGSKVIARRLSAAPWTLITVVPGHYIKENTEALMNAVVVAAAAIIIATCLTVIFITQTVSKRIYILSGAIANFKQHGKKDSLEQLAVMTARPERNRDEIDHLAITFVEMSARLEDSFQQILEMSLTEEKMNYQLLQSKINPHFLYNILESIKTCQTLGRIETANLMITKLAKFYRQLLQKKDDLITIGDELEIVVTYMEIEALCRNDSFGWELSLDDEIHNFLICKFTLQPIVENCIIHGIRSSAERMDIHISARYEEDTIRITVRDNGSGIQSKQLREIQKALRDQSINYSRHYGISNVNARLSLISKGDSGVSISSVWGVGTEVVIRIPQMI